MCDKDIYNNKEMIILNKQQVTKAIEKVLNSSKLVSCQLHIIINLIADIWSFTTMT